jgi:predicted dehydrogenase/nucleoside-diphosphate-sugar epimerase
MRVAIVGCGEIARMHIGALRAIGGLNISAVCDRDEQRARAALTHAPEARVYTDLARLLADDRPDAVHVLTPPATHAALAVQAMNAGCHVLVEKPMALSVDEADRMLAAARTNQVKLCTNHNYLRKPSVRRAAELVASGALGKVVYVEGYYGLSGEGGSFEAAGGAHWAYRLPGGIFTNFLPHLIYLQRAFLGEIEDVAGVAVGNAGGSSEQSPSELVVLLQGRGVAGSMTFSTLAKPYAKFIDIYGTRAIVHADLVREVCTIRRQYGLPRLLTKALYNMEESIQLASGTALNTIKVAAGSMKNMPELTVFFREFYDSIRENGEPPATGEDGRRMIQVMEQVWAKTPRQRPVSPAEMSSAQRRPQTRVEQRLAERGELREGKVLVTGAAGFLGRHLVAALWRSGIDVVALVRDRTRVPHDLEHQARIVEGSVADPAAVAAAMREVSVVFHCAAATRNNLAWSVHQETNVRGAQVVFESAIAAGVKRVVHVSSIVVYGFDGACLESSVDESAPYACKVDRWSHYLRSKIAAEQLAFDLNRRSNLPVTVLRPGIIYGPGGVRSVGRGLAQLGRVRLAMGSGTNWMPYTYVGNVVDAMLLAATSPHSVGQAYNIVDEPQLPMREWVSRSANVNADAKLLVGVPSWLLLGTARLLEIMRRRAHSDTPPRLSAFVVRSGTANIRYQTRKAQSELGWIPEVTLEDGLARTMGITTADPRVAGQKPAVATEERLSLADVSH